MKFMFQTFINFALSFQSQSQRNVSSFFDTILSFSFSIMWKIATPTKKKNTVYAGANEYLIYHINDTAIRSYFEIFLFSSLHSNLFALNFWGWTCVRLFFVSFNTKDKWQSSVKLFTSKLIMCWVNGMSRIKKNQCKAWWQWQLASCQTP